ncbi:response regulator transcription factor [Celeribacter marinus]|uniref:response regulator transcription factor n=1 Tax=Celeribacter marinus TaxID=1397108 RepID=UPI003F6C7FBA
MSTDTSDLTGHKVAPQSDNDTISVLIADDHSLVADAIKLVLLEERDFTVQICNSFETTIEAMQAAPEGFDVIMLDISMPGMEGLKSVKSVVSAAGDGNVVIFSGTTDDDFIWQAIGLGAKGFISKTQPCKSFASTLRLIADGNEFVPLSLARKSQERRAGVSVVDERERLILRSAAAGKTNKEIAIELDTTEVAIKMKMRAICAKLDARNRTHAAMIAKQTGLI